MFAPSYILLSFTKATRALMSRIDLSSSFSAQPNYVYRDREVHETSFRCRIQCCRAGADDRPDPSGSANVASGSMGDVLLFLTQCDGDLDRPWSFGLALAEGPSLAINAVNEQMHRVRNDLRARVGRRSGSRRFVPCRGHVNPVSG